MNYPDGYHANRYGDGPQDPNDVDPMPAWCLPPFVRPDFESLVTGGWARTHNVRDFKPMIAFTEKGLQALAKWLA